VPSPPYCRLDHSPSLADRFIFGVAPIDYDPVVLRRPSGPRLAASALPSGVYCLERWLQVHLGCIRLSPSCPFRLLHTLHSPSPAGEALPPPLDINPESRIERDFNPPEDVCCQAHNMASADFCRPLPPPYSGGSQRQIGRSPGVRRVTFTPHTRRIYARPVRVASGL
jgi:hypothetical protein